MNWIGKIFSNSKVNESAASMVENNQTPEYIEDINVSRDIFIDEEKPEIQNKPVAKSGNNVKEFLDKDYLVMGYQDGYTYHSNEMLLQKIKNLKAQFRFEIDHLISEKETALLKFENDMMDASGLSENKDNKFSNTLIKLKDQIKRLEAEKTLSVEDEGWVMKIIHQYHDGYIKGLDKYQEEKIIGISTGFFN
ncbi:MAG: hypothetical protein U5Q03_00145 [Bacteroidota bacterium]|nr:hypothetical protein [Bacteroidota bacterium]